MSKPSAELPQCVLPKATVVGFEREIARMTIHSKDRHVAAAAFVAGASTIVTNNLRHFSSSALKPFGIVALSPDDFLLDLERRYPERMRAIIERQSSLLRHPPMSPFEVLARLRLHAPRFVALMLQIPKDGEESGE